MRSASAGDLTLLDGNGNFVATLSCSPGVADVLRCIVPTDTGFICGGAGASVRIFEKNQDPKEIYELTTDVSVDNHAAGEWKQQPSGTFASLLQSKGDTKKCLSRSISVGRRSVPRTFPCATRWQPECNACLLRCACPSYRRGLREQSGCVPKRGRRCNIPFEWPALLIVPKEQKQARAAAGLCNASPIVLAYVVSHGSNMW